MADIPPRPADQFLFPRMTFVCIDCDARYVPTVGHVCLQPSWRRLSPPSPLARPVWVGARWVWGAWLAGLGIGLLAGYAMYGAP